MALVTEGKTKRICSGPEEHTVYLETFDILTGGDAAKKESIAGIALDKTKQAANVFSLLNARGIPTAFLSQHAPDTLLCHACDMIPLEFVVRRYAVGSYLLRNPGSKREGEPLRFQEPVWEIFHKDAVVAPPLVEKAVQMKEDDARKAYLRDGSWQEGTYTDPYIRIGGEQWHLHSAKKPVTPETALMAIEPLFQGAELEGIIRDIVLPTFQTLEEAWAGIETVYGPVALIDMKVELGRRTLDGKIVLADVIDNDSWRIWPGGRKDKQLDKQCFREDDPLGKVSENYRMVTELTGQFAG